MQVLKVTNPVQKSISNVFEDFLNEFPVFGSREWASNLNFPPVNIHETADAYHVEMNVPGLGKEDLKVNVENGLLNISFEKKEEEKKEGYKTIRREFGFRSFKRSFSLDENVDASQVQAKYENGLLKLLLPKKEQEKPSSKQITIE
ncbi:MAG: Hsp20/alpha crystallin family protein [Bacteroidetes bacterium]|nr:Hsp20/alpha crystallin family protein [Bacteroidota bacterium]